MELLTFLENDDLENFNENMSICAVEERDSKGSTILHIAVEREKYDFVDALMYHGADPDVENKDHETPLHFAARQDADEIFKLLWEYGADLDQENYRGETPKDIAQKNHSKKVLKIIEEIEED